MNACLTKLSVLAIGLTISLPLEARGYRWNCDYSKIATLDGLKADQFKLEFAFDDVTQKAVMIGNNGVADVEFQGGPLGVSFLERLSTGVVQSTTVANDGTSVHSRHTIIGASLIASQYYGRCVQK
jgi:hypothetical protein